MQPHSSNIVFSNNNISNSSKSIKTTKFLKTTLSATSSTATEKTFNKAVVTISPKCIPLRVLRTKLALRSANKRNFANDFNFVNKFEFKDRKVLVREVN